MKYLSLISTFLFLVFLQIASGAVLEEFITDEDNCELRCEDAYPKASNLEKACAEGCQLFKLIRLAKGVPANNKTTGLCFSACTEAYINESNAKACNFGCQQYVAAKEEGDVQTIHLLTPLFYMRSAYNSMAHHVRQFISASWTVYVQENNGKMIVLENNPKVYESMEYSPVKDKSSYAKNHQPWQEEKLDWMDCISHQSGIPRWCLVVVLFAFILALLWLCCATAVTAPNHYLSSKKKNVSYVLLCEPNPNDLKAPPPLINCDEEAPPLPPKVSLI